MLNSILKKVNVLSYLKKKLDFLQYIYKYYYIIIKNSLTFCICIFNKFYNIYISYNLNIIYNIITYGF